VIRSAGRGHRWSGSRGGEVGTIDKIETYLLELVWKPYATPYYPSMNAAVRAFVDDKFAPGTGIFRNAGPSVVSHLARWHPGDGTPS
jgi:hypothetical protein